MKPLLLLPLLLFQLVVPGAVRGQSSQPYGINVHLAENAVLEKAAAAGISWIRIDLAWYELEPEKGRYNFSRSDRVIQFAADGGLAVLGIIHGTPGWANDQMGARYPAADVNDWKRFVSVLLNRYRDRVHYWNIWNEPNVPEFFAAGKAAFVEQVFIPAAEVIKDSDPEARIVGPELAHLRSPGKEWLYWMEYILQHAGSWIDVISHHIYESGGITLLYTKLKIGEVVDGVWIPAVTSVVESFGYHEKPFWITETGWETASITEQKQADFYQDILETRLKEGFPDKIFFYEIIDDTKPEVPPWGILRSDLTEKPAYGVYADFIASEAVTGDGGCFLEKLVAAQPAGTFRPGVVDRFRRFRDTALEFWPLIQPLVDWYYRSGREWARLARENAGIRYLAINGCNLIDGWLSQIPLNQRMADMASDQERLCRAGGNFRYGGRAANNPCPVVSKRTNSGGSHPAARPAVEPEPQ